jgi:hypothetical protein
MTQAPTGTLVFKDQAGEYYLVPMETLEHGRVPEEHKAEIERLIAEQQDVQGYMWHALMVPVAVILTGTITIIREAYKSPAPLPSQPVSIPVEPERIR